MLQGPLSQFAVLPARPVISATKEPGNFYLHAGCPSFPPVPGPQEVGHVAFRPEVRQNGQTPLEHPWRHLVHSPWLL